ncbi:hypothetical protein SAMN00768000_1557 [Sulfobacillus thermosulfidooxidans DSM 9293]|uniref:Uncharacterized protein n=2 Tax=Sulfobacillus thermosulfidooxidans TaxID=28034 RepID=A0A1W1WDH8_SULTA|nr:hypothetical protein [Sulfobacillus thermosulfidooxidans]SMC04275.1 hypothetical protein SAMN00768000_1557 [Sulfobacillus thermosulfidooxidans DSM 9293]
MLALVSDLFFADRIIRIGQTVNEDVHVYHSQEEFKSAVMKDHPSVAIVELPLLDDSDLTWIAKIPHVAGYGPHVDRDRFAKARAYGIHPLWANSALIQKLGPWLLSLRNNEAGFQ